MVRETEAEAVGAGAEVGRVLDMWSELCGFGVLHDLTEPGRRANIDHVVVGARGVTVVDAKSWAGDVKVTPRGVRVGRWGKRQEVASLKGQVARVAQVLAEAGIDAPVDGALCLAQRNAGRELVVVGGVAVGWPEAVARSVATGDAWDAAAVEAAFDVLSERFDHRAARRPGDLLPFAAAPVAPPPVPKDCGPERRRRPNGAAGRRRPKGAARSARRRRALEREAWRLAFVAVLLVALAGVAERAS
ncbi:MAG: NERD domain-containing protein [Solirubrobacterales bacterium]|nr:NERD domain-containing protein [Solirubrobacterales bacterium]